MASRRPIRTKEILNPDRILSNMIKDYVDGNLDDYGVLHRAVVVEVDHVGGVLETEPPNPKNSVRARVITNARDKDLTTEELPVFWPLFPHDIMPVKESEHIYILYEDANNKSHGLWLARIPEPNNVDNKNIIPGTKKYEEDDTNDFSEIGVEQAVQDTDVPPESIVVSEEFVTEQVQPFTARVGDRVIEGSNNTIVVLGRDRPAGVSSGQQQSAGTIDIVAGRTSPENMNLAGDKSRIYVSMNSDVDGNFKINVGQKSGPSACVVIKSDQVRIVGRKGMKLVVEGGNVHVDAQQILLGAKAEDASVLGTKFMAELDKFLTQLQSGVNAGLAFGIPATVTMPVVAAAAGAFKARLQQLLSKKNKVE